MVAASVTAVQFSEVNYVKQSCFTNYSGLVRQIRLRRHEKAPAKHDGKEAIKLVQSYSPFMVLSRRHHGSIKVNAVQFREVNSVKQICFTYKVAW